jgi:mono/diheme cytochrome c family protein
MNFKKYSLLAGIVSVSLAVFGGFLAGCATATPAAGPAPAKAAGAKSAIASQNGAALWAQNCGHCHNIRSPDSYSDAQWDVAMLHMRVRANLTAEEHRQILTFLKSAH